MRLSALLALASVVGLLVAGSLRAGERAIDPPDEREFVLDYADLVSKDDTAKISEIGKKLLADTGVHLVVITIKKMGAYDGGDNAETFARKLLESWAEKRPDKTWTKAVLLIRAKEDKKVRTQLGRAWKDTQDEAVQSIFNKVLVPRLKAGEESKGFLEMSKALDTLLRKHIDDTKAEATEPPKEKSGK
jgi:uncharacterized protein